MGSSSAENIFPKWIHVLQPSDNQKGRYQASDSTTAALKLANDAFKHSQESSAKVSKDMATSQEEMKRMQTLIFETQEKHGNLLRDIVTNLRSGGARDPVGNILSTIYQSHSGRSTPQRVQTAVSAVQAMVAADEKRDSEGGRDADTPTQNGLAWLGGIFNTTSDSFKQRSASPQLTADVVEVVDAPAVPTAATHPVLQAASASPKTTTPDASFKSACSTSTTSSAAERRGTSAGPSSECWC